MSRNPTPWTAPRTAPALLASPFVAPCHSRRYSGVASSSSVPNGSRTKATRWPCGLSCGSASDWQPASSATAYAASTSAWTRTSSTLGGAPSAGAADDAAGEVVVAEFVGRERELRGAGVELGVATAGCDELASSARTSRVERRQRRVGRRRRRSPSGGHLEIGHEAESDGRAPAPSCRKRTVSAAAPTAARRPARGSRWRNAPGRRSRHAAPPPRAPRRGGPAISARSQTQHAGQPLGAVADRRDEPAAQLALADRELGRQRGHQRAGRGPDVRSRRRPAGRARRRRAARHASARSIVVTGSPPRVERWRRARAPSSPHTLRRSTRASRSASASTPISAGAAPGRIRAPTTWVPVATGTTNAVLLAPTTCVPAPCVHSTSMQPSGTTRTVPPSPLRSHMHASHGSSPGGGAYSR